MKKVETIKFTTIFSFLATCFYSTQGSQLLNCSTQQSFTLSVDTRMAFPLKKFKKFLFMHYELCIMNYFN